MPNIVSTRLAMFGSMVGAMPGTEWVYTSTPKFLYSCVTGVYLQVVVVDLLLYLCHFVPIEGLLLVFKALI